MTLITYVLADAYAGGIQGATVEYSGGLSFDIKAALNAGSGQFTVDDSTANGAALRDVLDHDPVVKRSGTQSGAGLTSPRAVGPVNAFTAPAGGGVLQSSGPGSVPDWLPMDPTSVFRTETGRYLAVYNGQGNESGGGSDQTYGIGFAFSEDGGRSFERIPGGKIFHVTTPNTNWDGGIVKDPSIAFVGKRLFMAYMGAAQGSQVYKIGLAVWNNGLPFGPPDYRALLVDPAAGGTPAWEAGACYMPHLRWENGVLHLWYCGQSTAGSTQGNIGHATVDINTFALTKDAANPLISPAATPAEYGLTMGSVLKDWDGTYHLFCGAFSQDFSTSVAQHYKSPAVNGPWTKQGIIYTPRANAYQLLTSDAVLNGTQVVVGDSSRFQPGDMVYVQDNLTGVNPGVIGADNWEANYVKAIPDGTHVQLRSPLKAAYTVARAAEIVAVDQVKIQPRSAFRELDEYVLLCTCWNAGHQTYHEEAVSLTTPSLAMAPYNLDKARGFILPKTGSVGTTRNAWDKVSAENMHAVPSARINKFMDESRRVSTQRQQKPVNPPNALGVTNPDGTGWYAIESSGPAGQPGDLDGYLAALSGDIIKITPTMMWENQAIWVYLDVAVVRYPNNVGGIVGWVSGGTGASTDQGVLAWRAPASVYFNPSAPIFYTVKDTDLQSGMVALRPMARMSAAGTRTLDQGYGFIYENVGGG